MSRRKKDEPVRELYAEPSITDSEVDAWTCYLDSIGLRDYRYAAAGSDYAAIANRKYFRQQWLPKQPMILAV